MSHKPCLDQIVEEFKGGKITGWCPLEKALDLAVTVLALRPKVVVETGVWSGRSLIPMALACKHLGDGICVAIDPWSTQASVEGYSGENADWWSKQDHDGMLKHFSMHIQRLGLEGFVQVQRAKSDDAVIPDVIDIFHCDSQHTDQAIREIHRIATNVRVGGIVILDDLSWQNEGTQPIAQAVDALISIGFKELYRIKQNDGEWGVFQRIKKKRS